MWSRRETRRGALVQFGGGCLACLCSGTAFAKTDEPAVGVGCFPRTGIAACDSAPDVERIGIDRVAPKPNERRQLELGIGSMLNAVNRVTALKMSASFYEDDVWPNAMATIAVRTGFDGELLIGWSLVSRILEEPNSSFYLAAILAHESGHIVQLRNNMCASLMCQTVVRLELHADFIAGAILRRAGVPISESAEKLLASNWRKLGDTEYGNFNHHGTPEQRLLCLTQGFQSAAEKSAEFITLARNAARSIDSLGVCRDATDSGVLGSGQRQ
jgi:hypothetical protein